MSSLVIRDATERDVPAIVAMLADDDKGGLREDVSEVLNPGYAAAFAAINGDPNHHLLVAERGGILIGTFQLSFLPGLSHRGLLIIARPMASIAGLGAGRLRLFGSRASAAVRG